MEQPGQPTEVTIFGKAYRLRAEGRAEELRHLARIVDRRMREIAPDPTVAEGMKVAILAAINFADETEKLREEVERLRRELAEGEGHLEEVSSRLSAVLSEVLEEPDLPTARD